MSAVNEKADGSSRRRKKKQSTGAEHMHQDRSVSHRRKMIAPVIITVIVVIYYAVFFGLLMHALENVWLKLLLGIIPILLAAVMIAVCTERIKEIKGGEEDDLSQY